MKYRVFVADLSSLYDDNANPPVVAQVLSDVEAAYKLQTSLQTHEKASWVEDENGVIIPNIPNFFAPELEIRK